MPLSSQLSRKIIPTYFADIKHRLQSMNDNSNGMPTEKVMGKFLGGGTDLYVQQHDTIVHEELDFLFNRNSLKGISQNLHTCEIGGAATVTDIAESAIFKKHFKNLEQYVKLISSTQIRNMATVAGNFTNASPIGDLTIFFLALNAQLQLSSVKTSREILLKSFTVGIRN